MVPIVALILKGVPFGVGLFFGERAARKGSELIEQGAATLGGALGRENDFLGIKSAVKAAKKKLKAEKEEEQEDLDAAAQVATLKEQLKSQEKLDKLEREYRDKLAKAQSEAERKEAKLRLRNVQATQQAAKVATESPNPSEGLIAMVLAAMNMANQQNTVPSADVYRQYGIMPPAEGIEDYGPYSDF